MSNLLVLLLCVLYSFQSAFCNMYSKNYPGNKKLTSPVFSVFYGLIVSAATLIFSGFAFSPSKATVILGILNGAVLVLYNMMLIKASENGPFSIVMIFNLGGGILIPMFWSIAVDGIKLSLLQYFAIALMLISFVFLNVEGKSKSGDKAENKKVSVKFLAFTTLLGLANGIYGTLLNMQKNVMAGLESADMIIVTFASSSVLAFLLLLVTAGKNALPGFKQNGKSAVFMIAASVSAAAAVNVLMHALGLINVAVLYAMDNGGVLLLSVLWSVVFFKERLSRNKLIGLILAVIAIFALGILQVA